MKQRLIEYDIIRAFLIVWIVCFWHLTNYYPDGNVFHDFVFNSIGGDITKFVLASFTLLSGLFLGQYNITSMRNVNIFTKKRLIRFYPLFAIACVTLYFTPCSFGYFYNSPMQLLLSLFGLSCFIGELPSTLWYMDMLLIFYIATPIILYVRKLSHKVLLCLILFLSLFCVNKYLGLIDNRIVQYSIFYMFGLIIGPLKLKNIINHYNLLIILLSLIVLPYGFIHRVFYIHYLYLFTGTIFLLVILFELSYLFCKSKSIIRVVTIVSYSSMAMYLFHRQVYALFELVNVNAILAIPFIIIISYTIQNLYDFIIEKMCVK